MIRLACLFPFIFVLPSPGWADAAAPAGAASPVAAGSAVTVQPCHPGQQRKKQPGDLSYETMWRMQQRVSAMLPRGGDLITPVLRLSVSGADQRERNEFMPPSCGIAILGKTLDAVLPMRRGGYFEVPAIAQAQARSEAAIVRFNIEQKKKSFEVAWQLAIPGTGVIPYGQLSRAFDELRLAQHAMAWWDIMLMDEKRARFDAVRACFAHEGGAILVDGAAAGRPLSRHCALLPFDAAHARANAPVTFVGDLESVTLDNTAHYGGHGAARN